MWTSRVRWVDKTALFRCLLQGFVPGARWPPLVTRKLEGCCFNVGGHCARHGCQAHSEYG